MAGVIDFEVTNTYTLKIRVSDGEFNDTADLTITVIDANEAPTLADVAVALDENADDGAFVTTIVGSDVDGDVLTYDVTAGNDAGHFDLDVNTGVVSVTGAIDFETTNIYTLTVRVSDGEFTDSATLTINVNDMNEAPTIADVQAQVDENSANGTLVTTLLGADVDGDVLTYAITAGNGAGHFTVDPNTGAVTVSGAVDFETTNTYSLTIRVGDGEFTNSATLTIEVNDINETPSLADIQTNVDENAVAGIPSPPSQAMMSTVTYHPALLAATRRSFHPRREQRCFDRRRPHRF